MTVPTWLDRARYLVAEFGGMTAEEREDLPDNLGPNGVGGGEGQMPVCVEADGTCWLGHHDDAWWGFGSATDPVALADDLKEIFERGQFADGGFIQPEE